ncbi:MFS transporter [Gordonibacter sp.]|uniref:MFS transporter n=1 Tax=Gordonibacter sp. TaxID=1968902 RepID=UPI002FC8346B
MTKSEASVQKAGGATAEKFLVIPVLVLMLAQMGTVAENATMGIAASALTAQLGATMSDIQLANMIYPLIAGAVMVAGGMLGIIIGWKKNLRIGLLLAALGELVAAVSPDMFIFTWGARVLVGLGGSLLVPSLLGIIPTIYKSGKNRALAFGCIGAAMGLANVLPLVLGALMDSSGFRITFGALGAYFLLIFLASFGIPKTEQAAGKLKFDTVGTVLAIVGLFLFLFGISRVSVWGLLTASATAPFSIGGISPAPIMAIAGIIVLVVLFRVERTVEAKNGCALIPRSFRKTPQVLAGLTTCGAIFVFGGAVTILLLPYLQLVSGWSALLTGLAMVVYGMPMFVFALGLPKLAPEASPRRIVQIGYFVTAIAAIILLFSVTPEGVTGLVWAGLVVGGIGSGFMSAQASNVVALAVNDRDAAQSGGVQATARNVFQAMAIAILGTILLFGISSGVASGAADSAAISPETKQVVAEQTYSLTSDDNFEAKVSEAGASADEQAELLSVYADTRAYSTQLAWGVTAVVLLACLLTTRWITVYKKEA